MPPLTHTHTHTHAGYVLWVSGGVSVIPSPGIARHALCSPQSLRRCNYTTIKDQTIGQGTYAFPVLPSCFRLPFSSMHRGGCKNLRVSVVSELLSRNIRNVVTSSQKQNYSFWFAFSASKYIVHCNHNVSCIVRSCVGC